MASVRKEKDLEELRFTFLLLFVSAQTKETEPSLALSLLNGIAVQIQKCFHQPGYYLHSVVFGCCF